MAVWAVMVFCGLAAGIGIFVANESMTWATTGKVRAVSDWNFNIESVLYFRDGKLGPASANRGKDDIEFWQPIDQQYGLGYMNFSAKARGIDHICSAVVFYPDDTSWNHDGRSIDTKIRINNKNNESRWNTNNKFSLDVDGKGLLYHLPDLKRMKPHGDKYDEHKENICLFRANGNKGTRNDMNFVDHIGGAQYLGERYDVREYVSAAYGKGVAGDETAEGSCPIIRVKGVNMPGALNSPSSVIGDPDDPLNNNRPYASMNRQCRGATILEFHFYPQNTLKNLDENLKFTTLQYKGGYHYKNWECTNLPGSGWSPPWTDADGGYHPGYHYCIDPIDYSYVDRHATVSTYDFVEYYNVWMRRGDSTTITFYYDGRGEFYSGGPRGTNYSISDVVARLKGTFKRYYLTSLSQIEGVSPANIGSVSPRASVPQLSSPNNRPYISNDVYNEYLKKQERNNFNGFLAVDDIDGNYEGYTPLKGVNRIFLSNKTRIKRNSIPSMFKPQKWLSLYCSSSDPFCSQEWFKKSKYKSSTSEDKNVSIYMQYTSTPENPLTLAYYTNGHASGIDSDGVPILYVVEDIQGYSNEDGGVVGTLKKKLEQYKKQYEEIYDEPLSITIETLKSNGMSNEESVNANTVLIYLEAERYTQYDPYIINRMILGDNSNEIPWYRDPALKNYIDPGVTDVIGTDKYIESGVTDATEIIPGEWQGKNFAVYFTKISRIVDDYQNTCYSNNISTN